MSRPLTTYTDAELAAALAEKSDHVVYSYNDYIAEIDRRSSRRWTRALVASTAIYALLTAILVAVTVWQALTR